MLSGLLQHLLLDVLHQRLGSSREQLHLVLGGLVGTEEAVVLIEAAAVHRSGHDVVHAQDHLRARILQDPLGALPGVDIAGDDRVRVVQDRLRVVCEDDLALSAALLDQVSVVFHIVHAGELMLVDAKQLPVLLQSQHVAVGVHAGRVDLVEAHQLVAHLVGGIAQHQHDLLRAFGESSQADGEAVSGKDRENDADSAAAGLRADILRDIIDRRVIALGSGDNRLRHCDDVSVPNGKALCFRGFQHAVCHDHRKVVTFTDDGAADSS